MRLKTAAPYCHVAAKPYLAAQVLSLVTSLALPDAAHREREGIRTEPAALYMHVSYYPWYVRCYAYTYVHVEVCRCFAKWAAPPNVFEQSSIRQGVLKGSHMTSTAQKVAVLVWASGVQEGNTEKRYSLAHSVGVQVLIIGGSV